MKASIDEEQIRLKAFELWQGRGCPIGSPQDDWFMAKVSLENAAQSSRPLSVVSSDVPLGLRIVTDQDLGRPSMSEAAMPRSRRRRAQREAAASSVPTPLPAKSAGKRKGR